MCRCGSAECKRNDGWVKPTRSLEERVLLLLLLLLLLLFLARGNTGNSLRIAFDAPKTHWSALDSPRVARLV